MTDPETAWRTAYRHPGPWDQALPALSMVDLFEASAAAHRESPLLEFLGAPLQLWRGAGWREPRRMRAQGDGLWPGATGSGSICPTCRIMSPLITACSSSARRWSISRRSTRSTSLPIRSPIRARGCCLRSRPRRCCPMRWRVLEKSALERLVVGSVAGRAAAGKVALLPAVQPQGHRRAPPRSRILAFSKLIDNDGACEAPSIDPERDLALIQYTGWHHRHSQGRDAEPPEPVGECAPGRAARSGDGQGDRPHPRACCRCSMYSPTPACSTALW